jgi:hypothetical protein
VCNSRRVGVAELDHIDAVVPLKVAEIEGGGVM